MCYYINVWQNSEANEILTIQICMYTINNIFNVTKAYIFSQFNVLQSKLFRAVSDGENLLARSSYLPFRTNKAVTHSVLPCSTDKMVNLVFSWKMILEVTFLMEM